MADNITMDGNKMKLTEDGGVMKEIIKNGVGDECPLTGCTVSVHYTGRLIDGTVFDSSIDRGEPFEFTLGKGQVIKAFDMGIATMKLREKCYLTCASAYAYGETGSPPNIPPHSTLIFELEMLGWKGEDVSPNSDGSIERFIIEASDKKRTPTDGAAVKVHLIGKYEGRIFEDREVRFDYGEGCEENIIEGVEIAVGKMTVGETCKIKIKPKYAYGQKGNKEAGIPPNASVEFIVKLIECEKGPEEWKFTDEERITHAELYKEKGTTYFKKENYALALKMYKKCIEILKNVDSQDVVNLKIAAHSNQILCYQKTNELYLAKNECEEVLKLDSSNIKAIYRRGMCYLGINEFQSASADFERVIKLDPSNKAAQNQLNICSHKIKEANAKERKIYANMFAKFGATDKKNNESSEPGSSGVLDKCGEWLDDVTKCEADLAFERDDIVMI